MNTTKATYETKVVEDLGGSGLDYFVIHHLETDSFVEGRFGPDSRVRTVISDELGIPGECFGGLEKIAFLDNLWVEPSRQDEAIGSGLVRQALELLHERGVAVAYGAAAPEFEAYFWPLIRFYERLGFEVIEECSQPGAAWVAYDLSTHERNQR